MALIDKALSISRFLKIQNAKADMHIYAYIYIKSPYLCLAQGQKYSVASENQAHFIKNNCKISLLTTASQ